MISSMISGGTLLISVNLVKPKLEKFSVISFLASEICKAKFK